MNKLVVLGILSLAILGFILILLSTRWGIGASPDSVTYIGGARNLVAGYGFSMKTVSGATEPITHFPPLYSMLLSLSRFFAVDPMAGARWINALLFGLNLLLASYIAHRHIPGSQRFLWLPLVGSLVVLTAPSILEIHLMAWTEALFLFLAFSGLTALATYLQRLELRYLLLAAMLISAAFMTRYAGAALIAMGFLGVIFYGPSNIPRRLKSAGLFTFISLLTPALWMAGNYLSAGTITSRALSFHPIGVSKIREGITTIASWMLVPESVSIWVKLIPIGVFALIFLYMTYFRRGRTGREDHVDELNSLVIVKLLALFVIVYLIFLVLSISFLDANTPMDSRILSPLFLAGVILALHLVGEVVSHFPKPVLIKSAFLGTAAAFIVVNAWNGSSLLVQGYEQGIGYSSLEWNHSGILSEIEKLPDQVAIYTNVPEAVYFFFNQAAMSVPRKFTSTRGQTNPNYQAEMEAMRSELENQAGVVVYFSNLKRPTLISEEELALQLPVRAVVRTADGVIYAMQGDN